MLSGQKCSLYSKITYLIRRSELAGGSGGFVDFFRLLALKPCDNVTVQLGINFSLPQVMSYPGARGEPARRFFTRSGPSSPALIEVGTLLQLSLRVGGEGGEHLSQVLLMLLGSPSAYCVLRAYCCQQGWCGFCV